MPSRRPQRSAVPFRDLREFLAVLRKHGELIDVERRVDLHLEVGKALRASGAVGGPAVLFRNNGTAFGLVGGIYNGRSKALLAFESTEATVFDRILAGLDRAIPPVAIAGSAPVHEVVHTGDDVDLASLPIPTYSPQDGGPFITPGIVVSNDPETGVPDIGHYRFQILDKTSMSFLAQPFHRFGKHIVKARALGHTRYPAAIVLGCEPVFAYACTVQVPDGTNDFEVAGGLRGEPVELVRCRTIDVDVPAHAEIVIEFEVDLAEDVWEGPLGEYTGYYTPPSMKPLARVTAITHRMDAIAQALVTGIPPSENHILKQLPFEVSFVQAMRRQFPTIERAAIPPSGGVSFYVVLAMRPRYAGEARHAILAALASNIRPKFVIVVEPDVDVQNSAEVEWALSFRVQPDRDVIIVDGLPAGPLDPSVDESIALDRRTGSAIGIDATRPFGATFPDVADVPGWQEYDFPELRAARSRSAG
jgi:2,5-furandicarboxylate decarboxylase 1